MKRCFSCGNYLPSFATFIPFDTFDLDKDISKAPRICTNCLSALGSLYIPVAETKNKLINLLNRFPHLFTDFYSAVLVGKVGAVFYPVALYGLQLIRNYNNDGLEYLLGILNYACSQIDVEYILAFKLIDPDNLRCSFVEIFPHQRMTCFYNESLRR